MEHAPINNDLVKAWQGEQTILYNQQQEWIHYRTMSDLSNSKFYLKTLSGLVICGELVINNAQLKEINKNKITMLRKRINEVSARVEAFRDLLNGFYKPFGKQK
ncbi:hypothetical protein QNI19_25990 [Cytophagaceae bacterium DM2B3-1]|uniref:Uncharacterized protein n=1 Tax=Xanthocytophaga flava TaxID=3048013 RepID=A0ABT7CTX5_9BACT|nr:hypothetical protein [Xanthocytophaga flavus]MDJ1468635.1 hypothetical protein [Xanthocytophaga flavus]MDJ1496415.1 hypothetical protein [Xanthocytophaga flavus]